MIKLKLSETCRTNFASSTVSDRSSSQVSCSITFTAKRMQGVQSRNESVAQTIKATVAVTNGTHNEYTLRRKQDSLMVGASAVARTRLTGGASTA